MMGVKKFNLVRSEQDPELYFGEVPADSAGKKLIAIPELNYKGSLNLVVLPAIGNPGVYISQGVDQLNTLLDSINSSNQSYLNSKAALQSLLEELKIKISSLPASDKQKIAEFMQANIFSDLQGITSFKQIKERPVTLLGLLIVSAYAQDVGNVNLNLNNFVSILSAATYLKTVGLAIGGLVSYVIAPPEYKPIVIAAFFLASVAVLAADNDAQEFVNSVHAIEPSSLHLKIPSQIKAGAPSTFSIWGQSVPLDSVAPASPLISKAINVKNNTNTQLKKINSKVGTVNSNLAFLGFSSQIEPMPLLTFPQTRFPTVLSTGYITNVQLVSSEDGQASIQNYSKNGNNLSIIFSSLRTQRAKLRVTVVNNDLGINKNIDTDIMITAGPKAVINYTKNNLVVDFDSSDPQNTNVTGLIYSWDFGDGETINTSSETISHEYSEAGSYTVSLTVTDSSGGSDTTQKIVDVTNVGNLIICNGGLPYNQMNFTLSSEDLNSSFSLKHIYHFDSNGNGIGLSCECKKISVPTDTPFDVHVTATEIASPNQEGPLIEILPYSGSMTVSSTREETFQWYTVGDVTLPPGSTGQLWRVIEGVYYRTQCSERIFK